MSAHETQSRLPGESDTTDVARISIALGVTAVIFALALLWAGWLTRAPRGSVKTPAPPAASVAIGSTEIGMVDQVDYSSVHSAQEARARERALLDQWAWVDRRHGLVRMPIEEAMRRVAAGERP